MKNQFFLLLLMVLFLFAGCGKNDQSSAAVTITGPEGMITSVAGREFKKSPLSLRLPSGKYMFRFSAPGKKVDYRLVTVGKEKKIKLDVFLEPVAAAVLIESEPSGAMIIIDNVPVGVTPKVLSEQKCGSYTAIFRKAGYAETSRRYQVDGPRPLAVKAELDSHVGSLLVKTLPRGAKVSINGVAKGETPFESPLDEGQYIIRVTKEKYVPVERQVIVRKGRRSSEVITLKKKPGALFIKSNPAGSEVFLNGRKYGVTPCSIRDLAEGRYELKLQKAGYDTLKRTINVAADSSETIMNQLLNSSGSVQFNVWPKGVRIFLDGEPVGESRETAPGSSNTLSIRKDNLAPGVHRLVLQHSYAQPSKKTVRFTVEKGKLHVIDNAKTRLWVANCEITYKDGTYHKGALYINEPDYIEFGISPGISQRIQKAELRKIVPLKND